MSKGSIGTNQSVYLDYVSISEIPSQVNSISCVEIQEALARMTYSGQSTTDQTLVTNYLNKTFNRTHTYSEYATVIAQCSSTTQPVNYVLAKEGAEAASVKAGYSYGFGGHEKDDEIKGSGNHLSFNDYGYDPRTGRRFCLDPHAKDYPEISPYAAFGDNPIFFTDPDGRDIKPSITFKASSFNPILNNLLKNNSSFNTALGKYKNDPKFNITLDINNAKVPAGKAANTSYNFNYQTVNGKKVTTSIEANISFRTDAGDNTNDLGKTTLLLHEYFHAYAGLQAVGGNDTKHDIWDNYLGLMQKAVQEYSDDNKLGLDATQVKELSIFNAGPGANIYDNYIKGLADKNKTTVEQEQSAFNDRINTLTTPKKEEAPVEEK